MAGINEMREVVKAKAGFYNDWPDKVDKMSDRQVTAIYLRLKAQGKL